MLVSVDEMKGYLRVDSSDEDSLITQLIETAELLCKDVSRLDDDTFNASPISKTAVLYAVAYLYEHREEANHNELTFTLRAMFFGIRKESF